MQRLGLSTSIAVDQDDGETKRVEMIQVFQDDRRAWPGPRKGARLCELDTRQLSRLSTTVSRGRFGELCTCCSGQLGEVKTGSERNAFCITHGQRKVAEYVYPSSGHQSLRSASTLPLPSRLLNQKTKLVMHRINSIKDKSKT